MLTQHSGVKLFSLLSHCSLPSHKLAFCFIARNRIPLDVVWNAFFRVDWGGSSMIEAERILLGNALSDPLNVHFVFVSDSFADMKEGRYNPKICPLIPVQNWRKGSQRRALTEFWRENQLQKRLEGEIVRRTLTHTSWDLSSSKFRERCGWHPVTYKLSDVTPPLIQSIKDIDNVYYETEYRREWCSSKGKPSACFLFARKFCKPTTLILLNMSLARLEHAVSLQFAKYFPVTACSCGFKTTWHVVAAPCKQGQASEDLLRDNTKNLQKWR